MKAQSKKHQNRFVDEKVDKMISSVEGHREINKLKENDVTLFVRG